MRCSELSVYDLYNRARRLSYSDAVPLYYFVRSGNLTLTMSPEMGQPASRRRSLHRRPVPIAIGHGGVASLECHEGAAYDTSHSVNEGSEEGKTDGSKVHVNV